MGLSRKLLTIGAILAALASYTNAYAEDKPKVKYITNTEEYKKDNNKSNNDKDDNKESSKYLKDTSLYVDNVDTSLKKKQDLGRRITGILEDECDFVEYNIISFGKDQDLVVSCYEKNGDLYQVIWATNLDNICRAYVKQSSILGINTSAKLITHLARGEVSNKSMGTDAATELLKIIEDYLPNNEKRCEDLKKYIQENYSPLGPID